MEAVQQGVKKNAVRTAKRSLVVHLHENHPKDRAGLRIIEEMLERSQEEGIPRPITLAFGRENAYNWLQSTDNKMDDQVRALVAREDITVALRKSQTTASRKELEQEYVWMTKYFKEPVAYCPCHRGRLTEEAGREASELGVRKVITTGLVSIGAFKDKGDPRIEIITVAPLHKIGFGAYRFIHLDQVSDYKREVEAHVRKGLRVVTDIEREGWIVYNARDSVKRAVNNLVHRCL